MDSINNYGLYILLNHFRILYFFEFVLELNEYPPKNANAVLMYKRNFCHVETI